MDEGMYVDHVILGVVDVDATAERLRREHGLGSVPGGIHLGGTTNRLVPLQPPLFLELLGVGDPSLADAAWLAETLRGEDRLIWWVVGVRDIDETARRRGLPVVTGTMDMADGRTASSFRTAGTPRYPLPFFIAYDLDPEARLRRWEARYREAGHESDPGGFTFVEVGGSPAVDAWLGDHGLPIRVAGEGARIRGVGIATDRGEVVIR